MSYTVLPCNIKLSMYLNDLQEFELGDSNHPAIQLYHLKVVQKCMYHIGTLTESTTYQCILLNFKFIQENISYKMCI